MARYKIELSAGTDYYFSFRPNTRDDITLALTPWNLTGLVFTMTIKDAEHQTHSEYTLEVEGGWVQVHLPAADTEQFYPHRRYNYTINVTYPGPTVKRVLDGPLYARAV
jgi:hypothetical protein